MSKTKVVYSFRITNALQFRVWYDGERVKEAHRRGVVSRSLNSCTSIYEILDYLNTNTEHQLNDEEIIGDVITNTEHQLTDEKIIEDVITNTEHQLTDEKIIGDVITNTEHQLTDEEIIEDVITNTEHQLTEEEIIEDVIAKLRDPRFENNIKFNFNTEQLSLLFKMRQPLTSLTHVNSNERKFPKDKYL